DESFCDICSHSHIAASTRPGTIILKSFGKFWGLAGLRLGFAIGDPALIEPLRQRLGPWAVSGPALSIGATALEDERWASRARLHLSAAAARTDTVMFEAGATLIGGTSLFRLYEVADAEAAYGHFARHHILTRTFPYSDTWLRLGLPNDPDRFAHVARAGGRALFAPEGAEQSRPPAR
ncbi:MAG: aminotransferase class I/II-fold pyridoxal phosphate-dependent enzyme, partial [Shimia sp.]